MFIVGERINPAGKSELARALREGKKTLIQQEAIAQERAGVQALDLNVYLPDVNRAQAMRIAVEAVRAVSALPLAIDDRDPEVLEAGLRHAQANSIINSPIDSESSGVKIFSLAGSYNSELFILPMKGNHIPASPKEHIEITKCILKKLEDSGIKRERVAIDAALLALKQAGKKVMDTLETIQRLKTELGVRALIGLSNISYGLRHREELNTRFLCLAKECGIDLIICDPLQEQVMTVAKGGTKSSFRSDKNEFLEFAETCLAV